MTQEKKEPQFTSIETKGPETLVPSNATLIPIEEIKTFTNEQLPPIEQEANDFSGKDTPEISTDTSHPNIKVPTDARRAETWRGLLKRTRGVPPASL